MSPLIFADPSEGLSNYLDSSGDFDELQNKLIKLSLTQAISPPFSNDSSRRSLFRAGNILQDIFYKYRELMFDSHIAKIEKTGDNINVYMAQRAQLPNQSWAVALAPFPSHICDELGIKNAILVNLACTDAVSWMLDMTKHFLQSLGCEFGEVKFEPKNMKTKITIMDQKEGKLTHLVWKVKLKISGEAYAIDLSAAQYGFGATVQPWLEYSQMYCVQPVNLHKSKDIYLGEARDCLVAKLDDSEEQYLHGYIMNNLYASESLRISVIKAEVSLDLIIGEILQLDSSKYEKAREVMLEHIDVGLEEKIKKLLSNTTLTCEHAFASGHVRRWGWNKFGVTKTAKI